MRLCVLIRRGNAHQSLDRQPIGIAGRCDQGVGGIGQDPGLLGLRARVHLDQDARRSAALFARLAPDPWAARSWADLAQSLGNRARRGKAVNLDPAALLMDMVLKIDETAGSLALR